ncbi:MAG: DUF1206 domain-containing protein [Novosphingobium sp.]|nr:DUF1206 domain-containing protein [Novosphingobium sp.]
MVDKSEKVVWLARLGYVARGVVYTLLGYLALTSSGADEAADGPSGAFSFIQDIPGGTVVLYLAAAGLFGYALFRLSTSILDTEHHGNDAMGIGQRIGHFASALVHFMLSYTAIQFANFSKSDGGDRAQEMAKTVLSYDLGGIVLGLVGIGFLIGAFMQGKRAATASFMKRVSRGAPTSTCWIGRIGHAARAVVFLVIGWSLVRSGFISSNSSEVKSLGDALMSLREHGLVYTLVAIGLLMFGVFSIIVARYRIIPDPDPKYHLN